MNCIIIIYIFLWSIYKFGVKGEVKIRDINVGVFGIYRLLVYYGGNI